MCSIPDLLGGFEVSERKAIQSRQTCNMGVCACDWEKDSPSNEPDGEEHLGHHTKESDEEVGIQTVYTFDIFDIGPPYRKRPGEEILGQTWDAFSDP